MDWGERAHGQQVHAEKAGSSGLGGDGPRTAVNSCDGQDKIIGNIIAIDVG